MLAGQGVEGQRCVLAGLVGQGLVELHLQVGDVVGEPLLADHLATHAAPGAVPGEVHLDAQVPLGHALAGEDVALVQLLVREHVAGFGQLAHAAGQQPALAGGATAHAAAVGEVDAVAQGGLQQGFLRVHQDLGGVDPHLAGAGSGAEWKHASSCCDCWVGRLNPRGVAGEEERASIDILGVIK